MSRAGRVVEAFNAFKKLPKGVDFDLRRRASKFERGLSKFLDRNIVRSFGSFKTEYEEGQSMKKRGVIQLINCTASNSKKMFSRWKIIN